MIATAIFTRRSLRLVERNWMVTRRVWVFLLAGFGEPLLYLFATRIGLGDLVGAITIEDGQVLEYAAFVGPGLLAASTMNGAIMESTFNVYSKLHWQRVYDSMLASPLSPADIVLGEIITSLLRGATYGSGFLVVLVAFGLVSSWWAVLVVPGVLLVGFAFAAAGLLGVTFMRTWQDFDFVNLATMPMFLFSATFYPIGTLPDGLALVVRATPLYQGVATLRAFTTGTVNWATLGHVAYLVVMGAVCLVVAARRFAVRTGAV